nr:hypothetical protein [Tanacetum cinerariifolium]
MCLNPKVQDVVKNEIVKLLDSSTLIDMLCKHGRYSEGLDLFETIDGVGVASYCYWGYTDAVSAVSCAPQARVHVKHQLHHRFLPKEEMNAHDEKHERYLRT